jgi:hypothetical protein
LKQVPLPLYTTFPFSTISGDAGNGLVRALASASLSAGTLGCIMCRSAAKTGTASDIRTTSNANILFRMT